MTTLIALALFVAALNLSMVFSLCRIRAGIRKDTVTLSRIMARGASVECRAMAEWRSR